MKGCALPEGVVFDFDGTLVDSEIYHIELYRQAAEKLDLSLLNEEYDARFRGRTDDEVFAFLGERSGQAARAEEMKREKQRYFLELVVAGNVPPMPGVLAFLDKITQRGIPMAVATSALRAEAEAGLNALGLLSRFKGIASAESVPRGKPAPDLYWKASEILGLQSERCRAYEDSVAGVRSASAAGMEVIGVGLSQEQALREAGALRVIPDFLGHDLA